LLILGK